jgi:hypothetical protein
MDLQLSVIRDIGNLSSGGVLTEGIIMAKRAKRKAPAKRPPGSRGPGRPTTTGIGKLVAVRCRDAFIEAVDQWRESQAGGSASVATLSRPAAIIRLVEIGLQSEGVERGG